MMRDDDVRAVLPEAPPPAPKRREAAIAEALARFDGMPAAGRDPVRPPAPWWTTLRRPQAGLFAAAALVAAISLPFAWQSPISPVPVAEERIASGANDDAARVKIVAAAPPVAMRAVTPPLATPDTSDIALPPPRSDDSVAAAKPMPRRQPAPAAPPRVMDTQDAAAIVVQGRASPQAVQESPVAVSVVSSEQYSSRSEGSIVVTGARIAPRQPVRRGDWNACTVNDPNRALSQCRKLADRAAKAVRSQADIHLSEGLRQAWSGDLDKAIAAFDAALAIAPDLSAAYLNRGITHDRQGDSAAAIADLDRAIRLAPKSARAYYNRAVLLRKYGDAKRASADEQQAINLDPRYQAVLR
jgi:hypothetical protein